MNSPIASSTGLADCVLSIDDHVVKGSLHDRSRQEADAFKWLESEKRGFDLGEEAIRQWIREHWNGYLRARWMEHLEGKHFWVELSADDFGLLMRCPIESSYLDQIVQMLKERGENFSILWWAVDKNLPTDEIRGILEYLDINSKRMECKLLDQPMG